MRRDHKLGNDIVDFSHREVLEKYQDTRFLARVFCDKEIETILNAENKAQFLWALWSAKEAAFKACQKQNTNIIFRPKDFEVVTSEMENIPSLGTLYYQQKKCDLQWLHPSPYVVHCCAVLMAENETFTAWNEIHPLIKKINTHPNIPITYKQQSDAVREELIHFLKTKLKMEGNLSVQRPEIKINGQSKKGPPLLFDGEKPCVDYDISLSHDQEWLAAVVRGSA